MSDEIEPHIFKKFEILQKLGKGAYGIVWKAVEKKTKRVVALKKVFEAFHNDTDAQRTFREVMILQELNSHDNVIKLVNVIKAENKRDLYLVFEFMETDLHAVIKAGILKKEHKQYIVYQLLKGLKYLHSGGIVHRDLKPSNLLVNSDCLVKIGDFGLARSLSATEDDCDPIMTEYVATRWYRAPEIVLGSNRYSKSVDMWSVGCILAELVNERALFPGKSTINQIELIMEVIGKPSQEDVKSVNSQNAVSILNGISTKRKLAFASHFKDTDPVVVDFMRRCLEFNPEKRMTVEEGLGHPYVKAFRDEKEETVFEGVVSIKINDNTKLSTKEYREALYQDIVQKKKDQKKEWRAKYLQQLGIPVGGVVAKRDLFKQLIEKKKEQRDIKINKERHDANAQNERTDDQRPKELSSKKEGRTECAKSPGSAPDNGLRFLQSSKSINSLKKHYKDKIDQKSIDSSHKHSVVERSTNKTDSKALATALLEKTKKRISADSKFLNSSEVKLHHFLSREKINSSSKFQNPLLSKHLTGAPKEIVSRPSSNHFEYHKLRTITRDRATNPPSQNTALGNCVGLFKQKPQSFQKMASYYPVYGHSGLKKAV